MDLVMAARHELLWWWRHGHSKTWARNVVDGLGYVRQASEVIVARLRRVLFERVKVILLAVKVILLVVAQRLAVRTGLVGATMSATLIRNFVLEVESGGRNLLGEIV